jgi:hypothetical protein
MEEYLKGLDEKVSENPLQSPVPGKHALKVGLSILE